MTQKELNEMVDDALEQGIIEADCVECGYTIQCEPDAKKAWCENCGKLVKINNFMGHFGLI